MPEPASITLFSTACLGLVIRALQRRYRAVRPYVDWMAAFVLFVLSTPAMLFCAMLVKLTSRGPVFYTQERVGQFERVFRIIKFRTMYDGAESETGPVWASGDADPRVTPVGRVLRRLHLDELPQLINVLRGEMSLIGPRPERPHFVAMLREQVRDYGKRFAVKPGITGLAQVKLGYDRTLRDVRRKVKYDCMYIRRMCWWVDFLIISGTAARVLLGRRERRSKRAGGTLGAK